MAETPTKQFNTQQYRFEITFLPYGSKDVPVNPDSVVQLVLEEQIIFWATKGFLILQNANEMFQRTIDTNTLNSGDMTAKQKQEIEKIKNGYIFRNDGRDRVNIKIKPIKQPFSEDAEIEEVPDKSWLIDFTGNIYDVEEPMVSDFGSKVKKLYFWHEDWQKMLESNCYTQEKGIWSTATSKSNPSVKNKDPAQLSDEERKMFTGDAIRDLFENTLGFEIDENNFDKGKTKIFHTSAEGWSCLDNIYYLWENHLSEHELPSGEFDVSIISYDNDTKKYQFLPLSKIFEKAGDFVNTPGEYQIEHLILEDVTHSKKTQGGEKWMAPILKEYDPEFQKDIKVHKLKKYSFTEMAGVDSMRDLITHSIHTYDRKNKTFVKITENAQVKDLPTYLQDDYITNKFLKVGDNNTFISLNEIKTKNIKTKNVFTPISNRDVANRLGHGNLIFKSIFFNLCLTVELEGSTNRKVARFIGVDRLQNNNNEFDYQLGGQWLVTRVNHNFFKNTYVNELNLVKHQIYDKINFNSEIISENKETQEPIS
jgi:hypothetical protein